MRTAESSMQVDAFAVMKRSPIAPLAGKLSDRIGRRPILSLGTFLHGVGIEWLAILASDHVNYSALVPPLILSGVGISMSLPVVPTAALSAVPLATSARHRASTAPC